MASLIQARRRSDWIPALIVAATVATIAVGLTAKLFGVYWGAPAQPLTLILRPALSSWALVGVVVLGVALLAARWLFRSQIGSAWFGLALFGLTLASRLALNVVRGGPHALYADFVIGRVGEGRTEYLPALGQLSDGAGAFLERYVSLVPTLPVHAAGHPPGLLLTLNALGIDTAAGDGGADDRGGGAGDAGALRARP